MGARRAGRTGRGRMLRAALVAVMVTVAAVALGVAGDQPPVPEPEARPTPTPSATPPAELDLSGLPIVRGPFCDRIDEQTVTTALQAPVGDSEQYVDGERARLTPDLTDVAHEFGCAYRSESGVTASAWVFAAPVTATEARHMVRSAEAGGDCAEPSGAPTFGRPGTTLICRESGAGTLSMRGLFGDAWLSCELSMPDDDPSADATASRGIRWCVHVATAVGARP